MEVVRPSPSLMRQFNMFNRLAAGWQLAKQSLNVLRLDKELLMFPILSGLACLVVTASFAAPLVFSGMLENVANQEGNDAAAPENLLFYGFCNLFHHYLFQLSFGCLCHHSLEGR